MFLGDYVWLLITTLDSHERNENAEFVKTQKQEAVCADIVYVHKGLKPGRWLLPIGKQGFQGHPPLLNP